MFQVVNGFLFSGGAAAGYLTAEALGEVSTTDAGYFDTVTLSVGAGDLRNGEDYIGLWSVSGAQNVTDQVLARVTKDGNSIFTAATPSLLTREIGAGGPQDYHSFGGMFRHQETGVASEFKVQCSRSSAATIKAKDARLSLVVMGADDHYSETIARNNLTDTTANKTATTVGSITFTPATSGDYIILCSFIFDMGSTSNVAGGMTLTDGTATTGEIGLRCRGGNDRMPALLMLPLSGVSGSKTVDLKIRQTGSGTTTVAASEMRFVALRTDRFADAQQVTQGANNSGTNTTYSSTVSQTFTPNAADYLVLGSWVLGTNNGTTSGYAQLLDGATAVNEHIGEYNIFVATSGTPGVSHRIGSYAASSRTQAIQRKSNTSSTSSTVQKGMILSFDLTGI